MTKISALAAVTDVQDTDEYVLARAGTTKKIAASDLTIGVVPSYVKLSDEKTQNTQSGTFTTGAWQTRVLNTEVDPDGICTLTSNQFVLAAGTYECEITCPAWDVGRHQARLQNITGGTTILPGTSEFVTNAGGAGASFSRIAGRFTVASSQTLEVQHRCAATKASQGLGIEGNFGTEVYAVAVFRKVG